MASTQSSTASDDRGPTENPRGQALALAASTAFVFCLAWLARQLNLWGDAVLGHRAVEFPLWAAGLGLVANAVISGLGVRDRVNSGFRTELYLKIGLVLMGASVNFAQILRIGAMGLIQAAIIISCVFGFTWWVSGLLRLDDRLRALMSASVSICGVSAAIAAAGAVEAKKEQLAYVTTLTILFALPLMVLMPIVARALGLPADVAGAWIGGNIDTTAAVVGAGAVHSEAAMQVASIVKMSQNALIGVPAFLLALYWVMVVERTPERKPSPIEIWNRFPKFVLGFMAASLLASLGLFSPAMAADIKSVQTLFLTLAFVCIGLEFALEEIKRLGAGPVGVYMVATLFNTCLGLPVAYILFGGTPSY